VQRSPLIHHLAICGHVHVHAGYLHARELAHKLVATYCLCSEQLSSQSHYDFGMRAVIAVLRAAGVNKQKNLELPEGVLMLRSIRDINAPKFLPPDIPLFDGILSDLFPDILLPPTDYNALDDAFAVACNDLNLQRTPCWLLKVCPFCIFFCGCGQIVCLLHSLLELQPQACSLCSS
jgi:dynein heavy chain, axonemal